jgi:hypothetical protein
MNSIEKIIIENNKLECRKVLNKAIKTMDNKEYSFSRKMVKSHLQGLNCSPEELIEYQKQGNIFMTVAECKECLKMIGRQRGDLQ